MQPGNFGFKVDPGMLTSMGVRQRYLLGKYHYNKYKDLGHGNKGYFDFDKMLAAPVVEDLDVISTDFYRTIQSGYSELLGLTEVAAESNKLTLNDAQATGLSSGSRGVPPFTVRNATNI